MYIESTKEMLKIKEFIFFDPNKPTSEIKININAEITEKFKIYQEAMITESNFLSNNFHVFNERYKAKTEQERQDISKKYKEIFEKYGKVQGSVSNSQSKLNAAFNKWMQ